MPFTRSRDLGNLLVVGVMTALLAHPDVWRKIALLVTSDENGGRLRP